MSDDDYEYIIELMNKKQEFLREKTQYLQRMSKTNRYLKPLLLEDEREKERLQKAFEILKQHVLLYGSLDDLDFDKGAGLF